jgi:hypothetical protein
MPMKIKLSTILLGGAAFAVIGAGFVLAQAVDPRIEQYDKGPATINVSRTQRLSGKTTQFLARNARSATS